MADSDFPLAKTPRSPSSDCYFFFYFASLRLCGKYPEILMARVGTTKNKKSSRATELSRLRKELQLVTEQLESRDLELAEALGQQAATGEVLGIISRSAGDVQPALDAIVETAAKVCGIDDVVLRLVEGEAVVARAHFGSMEIPR